MQQRWITHPWLISSPIHYFIRRTSSSATCPRYTSFTKSKLGSLHGLLSFDLCSRLQLHACRRSFLQSAQPLSDGSNCLSHVVERFFVSWRHTRTTLSWWAAVFWRGWVWCHFLCWSGSIDYWDNWVLTLFSMFLRWRICRSMRSTARTSLALSLYGDSARTALSFRSSYLYDAIIHC